MGGEGVECRADADVQSLSRGRGAGLLEGPLRNGPDSPWQRLGCAQDTAASSRCRGGTASAAAANGKWQHLTAAAATSVHTHTCSPLLQPCDDKLLSLLALLAVCAVCRAARVLVIDGP